MSYIVEPVSIMVRKGKISTLPAKLGVTDTGLELGVYPRWTMMFGLIGLLLRRWAKMTMTNIPASSITAATQESFGMNKEMIAITLADGSEHRFLLKPHFEKIAGALEGLGVKVQRLS